MIATPQHSLEAAARVAEAAGLRTHVLSDEIEGESREVAKVHAALARAVARHGQPFAKPCVILSGGETTVTIRQRPAGTPKGRGGRAGEFCMGLAQACRGRRRSGRWRPIPMASMAWKTMRGRACHRIRWRGPRPRECGLPSTWIAMMRMGSLMRWGSGGDRAHAYQRE